MSDLYEVPPDKQALERSQVHRVELALSYLLRGGVILSSAIVLLGIVMMFVHHPEYRRGAVPAADVIRQMAFPHTLSAVWAGLAHMEGRAIVIVGLFVLIATPVMRVAASVVVFIHLRDRMFAAITFFVLMMLLISFLLGRAGG
jgi:uncharacterized membrane protein